MSVNQEYGLISKLYKSRKNLLNQLRQIGYNTDDYTNFSANEINILYQQDRQDMLLKNVDGGSLYVKYNVNKAIRPQTIHDLVEDLFHLEAVLKPKSNDYLMIVAKDGANDTLTNLLVQLYASENIFVNIVSLSELQFSIMDHILVPKHTKLSDEEVNEMKKKYNVEKNNDLPKISRFDPVARIIGLKPNSVCRIVRPSPTAIQSEFYRLCVNK